MIAATRAAVRNLLAEYLECPVFDTMPERINPPFVYLGEADDFVTPEDGGPFGSWQVNFAGGVVVKQGSNQAMIAAADDYAAGLITVGDTHRADVIVSGYQSLPAGTATFVLVPFTLTTPLTKET